MRKAKKILSWMLSVLLILGLFPGTALKAEAAAWNGSEAETTWYTGADSSYDIHTPQELAGLAKLVNEEQISFEDITISLQNDIDLGKQEWIPIGAGEITNEGNVLGTFDGIFYGNGYTISGLKTQTNHTVSKYDYSAAGLFGFVDVAGIIQNLTVEGSIHSDKTTSWSGGIAGYNMGKIIGCTNKTTVTGKYATGGIAGENDVGEITNCVNIGTITHNTGSNTYAGGIVGLFQLGTVSHCVNRGDIISTSTSMTPYLGGIAGAATSPDIDKGETIISNCLNMGYLHTEQKNPYIGGLVGSASYATKIRQSVNMGLTEINHVDADYRKVGGLIGSLSANPPEATGMWDCYYLENTQIGAVGEKKNNPVMGIVASKTAAELEAQDMLTLLNLSETAWGFDAQGKLTLAFLIPGKVASLTPSGTDVQLEGNLEITFSKSMRQSGTGTVTLSNGIGELAGGSWLSDTVYTVPYNALAADTAYTVTISGFQDADFHFLETDTAHSFTTLSRYTVAYDANGGTGSAFQEVVTDAAYTVATAETAGFAKKGYAFTGWCTTKDGKGTLYQPGDAVTLSASVQLYALWEELDAEYQRYAYILGYPDGTIRPRRSITREEVSSIFLRLLPESELKASWKTENAFTDVSDTRWSNSAISTLQNREILSGYPGGSFKPSQNITRAEFTALLIRWSNMEGQKATTNHFQDVSSAHWAVNYINLAYENGFVYGDGDGNFRPNKSISRAEAMAMINRMLGNKVKTAGSLLADMQVFSDNQNKNEWFYVDVQLATNSRFAVLNARGYETWIRMSGTPNWDVLSQKNATPADLIYPTK